MAWFAPAITGDSIQFHLGYPSGLGTPNYTLKL